MKFALLKLLFANITCILKVGKLIYVDFYETTMINQCSDTFAYMVNHYLYEGKCFRLQSFIKWEKFYSNRAIVYQRKKIMFFCIFFIFNITAGVYSPWWHQKDQNFLAPFSISQMALLPSTSGYLLILPNHPTNTYDDEGK